ncbi:putative Zinc finger protein [Blattamonas nauphoetae]|uniref:Zinc finger protein n=1 Tax=Blattamonas nauphoetae TaxID=2049346 RepID=A0ABQ9Y2U2_9EUKA|nr:putative Zinc finger protein [Blattamonas nauphoetae]
MSGRATALYCYICGLQYGTAGLPKHLNSCPEKYANEQKFLPKALQEKAPDPPKAERPTSLKDQTACKKWNTEAYDISRIAMNDCPYCQRKFASDRVVKHVQSCSKKPAGADDITVEKKTVTSKPKLFICGICGREYGTASIEKHMNSCIVQFRNDQAKVPASARREEPDLKALLEDIKKIKEDGKVTSKEIQAQRENATNMWKESLAKCPNCERTFESEVLEKHLKGCKSTTSYTVASIKK